MKQNKGLGRGLDAIFSTEKIDAAAPTKSEMAQVAIDDIDANEGQPRRDFDQAALEALSASITSLGVIQPITLRRKAGRYQIISGERRYRAAKMAGLGRIPAYIRDVEDLDLYSMALVENLQREDLNPIEIAMGMNRLIEECSLTQEMLAERLSMKRSTISNYLRLIALPAEVQYKLKSGVITMGHAKAIAGVQDVDLQLELLRQCCQGELSVRACEELARKMQELLQAPEHEAVESEKCPLNRAQINRIKASLSPIFSGKVAIKPGKGESGKIVIEYSNESEIEQFIKYFEL